MEITKVLKMAEHLSPAATVTYNSEDEAPFGIDDNESFIRLTNEEGLALALALRTMLREAGIAQITER